MPRHHARDFAGRARPDRKAAVSRGEMVHHERGGAAADPGTDPRRPADPPRLDPAPVAQRPAGQLWRGCSLKARGSHAPTQRRKPSVKETKRTVLPEVHAAGVRTIQSSHLLCALCAMIRTRSRNTRRKQPPNHWKVGECPKGDSQEWWVSACVPWPAWPGPPSYAGSSHTLRFSFVLRTSPSLQQENAARGAPTMPAPLCSCTCGRQVFDAYVKRGQSARLALPCGSVHLARKVACTERFLRRRPDMAEDLKRHLLMGKQKGRGSGPWARALQILTQNVERPPADVLGFLCGSPMTAASADTMPTSVTALPTTEMYLTAPKTFKSSSCDAESSRAATPSRDWQSCALTQKA